MIAEIEQRSVSLTGPNSAESGRSKVSAMESAATLEVHGLTEPALNTESSGAVAVAARKPPKRAAGIALVIAGAVAIAGLAFVVGARSKAPVASAAAPSGTATIPAAAPLPAQTAPPTPDRLPDPPKADSPVTKVVVHGGPKTKPPVIPSAAPSQAPVVPRPLPSDDEAPHERK